MPSNSAYLKNVFGQPQSDSKTSREKVLTQALELENEVAGLKSDLSKCWQQMDRNDRDYKSAADRYLLSGDPRKEQ